MEAFRWSASQLQEGISRRLETRGRTQDIVRTEESGLKTAAGLPHGGLSLSVGRAHPFFSFLCRRLGAGTSPHSSSPSPSQHASSVAEATSQPRLLPSLSLGSQ